MMCSITMRLLKQSCVIEHGCSIHVNNTPVLFKNLAPLKLLASSTGEASAAFIASVVATASNITTTAIATTASSAGTATVAIAAASFGPLLPNSPNECRALL